MTKKQKNLSLILLLISAISYLTYWAFLTQLPEIWPSNSFWLLTIGSIVVSFTLILWTTTTNNQQKIVWIIYTLSVITLTSAAIAQHFSPIILFTPLSSATILSTYIISINEEVAQTKRIIILILLMIASQTILCFPFMLTFVGWIGTIAFLIYIPLTLNRIKNANI